MFGVENFLTTFFKFLFYREGISCPSKAESSPEKTPRMFYTFYSEIAIFQQQLNSYKQINVSPQLQTYIIQLLA